MALKIMLGGMFFRRAMLAAWIACATAVALAQISPTPPSAGISSWPVVESDLPADPALVQGTLPNGLRYLILPNAEPRDKVSLRLLVHAGSLHENNDERGLAHFVEHMAFRGTRAFPAGSMAAALQRIGVGLGPDSTAFTTYGHTIYHLELPDTAEATLHEGLKAFREYAEAVTFDPKLIEQERGVVLAEMATRDTSEARGAEANIAFLWPNSREVRRKVIGLPEQLRTFTREQFVAFYDAWYRPERMAVIAVGAIEPAAMERLIAEHFGSFQARGPARPEPVDLVTTEARGPDVGIFVDRDVIGFGMTLERPFFTPRRPSTAEEREREVYQALAFAMLRLRLDKLASNPDAAFIAPETTVSRPWPQWKLAAIGVSGRFDDWRKTAAELEQEHRRAIQFGFTERELKDAVTVFRTMSDQLKRTAATRASPGLAQELVGAVLGGTIFTTPDTTQRELAAALDKATVGLCLAAFREAWSTEAPSVFVSFNSAFKVAKTEVAAALNESRKVKVTAPEETAIPTFAYTDFGPAGKLVEERRLEDLGVRLSRFANNVCLNFKQTAFEADEVNVFLRFGDGKLSQPKSQPGLDTLAEAAFTGGGLGRHTAQELTEILRGHALGFSFDVQEDACGFYLSCAPRELEMVLQVAAAYLSDARFRPDGLREADAKFNTMYASLGASPSGPITLLGLRETLSGDRRFSLPLRQELELRTLDEVQTWLKPQLTRGAVELSIVGDVTWEEASAAVARTLGALPDREPVHARATPAAVRFAKPLPKNAERTFSVAPTLKQAAFAWYWPAPAVTDRHEERRCHLLATILENRLHLRLREEIGATYAPTVKFANNETYPTLNYFIFYAELDPQKIAAARTLIAAEVESLRAQGPTPDEFERARQPHLRSIADTLRSNGYWGAVVLSDAQQRPARLDAARDRTADNQSITRDDMTTLAQKYLNPTTALRYLSVPAKK